MASWHSRFGPPDGPHASHDARLQHALRRLSRLPGAAVMHVRLEEIGVRGVACAGGLAAAAAAGPSGEGGGPER
jgi:hypothetical protein